MHKTIVFTIAFALAANAQRIETEKSDRNKVVRVETAPNHLTIIELGEPVAEVAAGSSSYKIEWRGNKVFVQPLEPAVKTNLFIWTASGRLTYELSVVPSVSDAQFAIDQEPRLKVALAAPPQPQPAIDTKAIEQAKLASEMLLASQPVRLSGGLKRGRVQIVLKDMYRSKDRKDRIYVRYAIQNDGQAEYQPGTPGVFLLRSPQSTRSLYGLSGSQLADDHSHITADGQTSVKIVDAEVHSSVVPPKGMAFGLISFDIPSLSGSGPTVLRFTFPSDTAGDVSALLVL